MGFWSDFGGKGEDICWESTSVLPLGCKAGHRKVRFRGFVWGK